MQNYIISILGAAMICGILKKMVQEELLRNLIHMLCGLVLTLVILRPLGSFDFGSLDMFSESCIIDGKQAAWEGEKMARDALSDSIKEGVEAYISDKAAQVQANIQAEVFLNEENIPVSLELHGNISPYAKAVLADMIETDLGITEENQLWTG